MNRRQFSRRLLILGAGSAASTASLPAFAATPTAPMASGEFYEEPARKLPVRKYDVVVAGGGTAGVVAALAAARNGARTALIESKGYTGGTVTEGGTAIHSFYNLWKAFPGVAKRQVVAGLPQEIIDQLTAIGGCTGYPEMERGVDYDSVCTCVDTELYKLVTMRLLAAAGVHVCVNTLVAGAVVEGGRVLGAVAESRSGREFFAARCLVDCTAYADLAAHAGARFTEPNDYASANSIGVGNVDLEAYYAFLRKQDALGDLCRGRRSGRENQLVRLGASAAKISADFAAAAGKIGLSMVTTTVHDNYCMFLKLNFKVPGKVTERDAVAVAELELRQRQFQAIELLRKHVPGFERAFITRTSPSLNIRRGRLIACDYDLTRDDVLEARHFEDEVFVYGFHDNAPRLKIKNGGTYGIPYRAVRVAGRDNLLVAGMMITSNHDAHMSTRNTVSCMAQGQATGTAAALCAARRCGTRDLPYGGLRDALMRGGVYFES